MNSKIKLKVQGLTDSQMQSGAYALILTEEGGKRTVPIIIGMSEAQSILLELESITPSRPLTHDLFSKIFEAFDIYLREVYIYKWDDSIFFSELVFEKKGIGGEVRIDSRTSDAIAIALREGCDIYINENVINTCGVVVEDSDMENSDESEYDSDFDSDDDDKDGIFDDENDIFDFQNEEDEVEFEILEKIKSLHEQGNELTAESTIMFLSKYNISELKKRMESAIIQEKYEYAQIYRDELARRAEDIDSNDDKY